MNDPAATITAAQAAFRAGDWLLARSALESIADRLDASTMAMLATARWRLGDTAGAHAAVDKALGLDVRSLRAVLVKADLLADEGARREANVFYRAAVDIGGKVRTLPADLAQGVERARAWRERLVSGMGEALQAGLAEAGYAAERSPERFTHALDLALGRRRVFVQEPRNFYYPELPNTQFYPRDVFPWLDVVEAAVPAMIEELQALLEEEAAFSPYLQTLPGVPSRPDYPLIDSLDWSSAFLWRDGHATANAERCPRTMAALEAAPLCRIAGRSPQVMFSQLKPGAHIRPHTGAVNTRLICHVPLIVPPGCSFRVGNDVRRWEAGKAWVFDDTIEHEARNDGDQTRVVLIFDIWRPELTPEEQRLVAALLEILDAYSPTAAAWE